MNIHSIKHIIATIADEVESKLTNTKNIVIPKIANMLAFAIPRFRSLLGKICFKYSTYNKHVPIIHPKIIAPTK